MAGYRVLLLDAKASKDATDNIIKQTGAVGIVCNEDAEMEEEYVPSENLKQAVAEQMSASTQDSVKQTPPPENDIWEVSLEKREI